MQNLLSDEELRRLADLSAVHRDAKSIAVSFARNVESAVLAKAEVEARERERTVWDNARAWMWGRSLAFKDVCVNSLSGDEERDRLYPSLRPPKTVTLSTGTWWKNAAGYWECNVNPCRQLKAADVATLDDAEKLASYLRAGGK